MNLLNNKKMDTVNHSIGIIGKKAAFLEKQNKKIIIKDILNYTYKKGILENVYLSENNEDLISLNNFESIMNRIRMMCFNTMPEKIILGDGEKNMILYKFNIKNFNDNYFKIMKKNINLKEDNFNRIVTINHSFHTYNAEEHIQKTKDNYKKEGRKYILFETNNTLNPYIFITDWIML